MGPEGRAGARGAHGAADADGLVLREGGRHSGDIVTFVLSRAWSEIENGPSQKGADDCMLKWGDDTGVDGGVHDPVLHGIETVGKDVIVPHNVHVARNH